MPRERSPPDSPTGLGDLFRIASVVLCLFAAAWRVSQDGGGKMRRASLAASVARRVQEDARLLTEDKHHAWYHMDASKLSPAFASKFVPGEEDAETRAFVEQSVEKSDWFFTQMWHNLAKSVLGIFGYTQTDVNGILGRGSMFVLSERHFLELLKTGGAERPGGWDAEEPAGSLVDLGAGDGVPMRRLSRLFRRVYATEASPAMRRALSRSGVELLEVEDWHEQAPGGNGFDLVACLNLLDRCERPLSVLSQVRRALRTPGGLALVAVVLPFSPYVEFSSSGDRAPVEKIDLEGATFEEQAESLSRLLEQQGFQVLSWTRVPYLCEGDLASSVYTLNDVVFLLRSKSYF